MTERCRPDKPPARSTKFLAYVGGERLLHARVGLKRMLEACVSVSGGEIPGEDW